MSDAPKPSETNRNSNTPQDQSDAAATNEGETIKPSSAPNDALPVVDAPAEGTPDRRDEPGRRPAQSDPSITAEHVAQEVEKTSEADRESPGGEAPAVTPEASTPSAPSPAKAAPAPAVSEDARAPEEMTGAGGEAGQAGRAGDEAATPLSEVTPSPTDEEKALQQKGPSFINAEVKRVTNDALILTLPGDREGRVPLSEYAGLPVPTVGENLPIRVDTDEDGTLTITRVSDAEHTFWDSVKEGDALEGVVTGMNKGGLDIDIGGARAFLPASHVDTKPVKDISTLIGEHVTCIVTQVDRTSRDLVVSRRKFLRKAHKQKRHELFEGLEEGQTRHGKVASVTDYGAFVDLGGANGLLHMSDMTWGRIKHPSELVQPEQELDVKVLKVDPKKGKISLGLKQLQPDPWENIQEKYPKESKVKGRVISLTDFGAFLEMEPGIEALLPLSEMSWSRHVNRPSDMVSEGQEVEAVVLRVDPGKRKFSVGTKQLQENPWANIESRFPVNDTFKGKVTRTTEFGAFVEVAEGVEGLVHISELSDKRVRAVTDVVNEGDEVEVRVIKVDPKAQRLSLSTKPLTKQDIEDARPKRKKKRPERGGLTSHIDSDTRNKTGLTLGM